MGSLSVLMPTRNRARYLEAAIESILNQTYRDFDLLIMDDGSTDETPAILKRYAKLDDRIKLFFRPQRGLPTTRNELLELANSRFVAWIDSDDRATPQRLQTQLDAMLADEDLWVLGTSTAIIDADDRLVKMNKVVTGAENVKRRLIDGCKVVLSSSIMRREPILALGGYRLAFTYAQDYDLFLRVSERGKIDNLDILGLHYRFHNSSVTTKNQLMQAMMSDLARASHLRQASGLADPIDQLTKPPDLFNDAILDTMLGDTVNVYRALHRAQNPAGEETAILRDLVHGKLSRKQRSLCQAAIVDLIRKRHFDWLSARGALRAASLNPIRFLRKLLSAQA